jgi:hypothetical protein
MEVSMSDLENNARLDPDAEQDLEQAIRERAFLLWEMEGRPEGREEEYWHRARERIEAETHAAYPPAQAGHHRT